MKEDLHTMFNFNILKNAKGSKIKIPNTDDLVDSVYIKELRTDDLKMTQAAFANALGVSIKTVEKWERGGKENNISGIAKKLIYLLKLDKNLIRCLYFFDTSEKQSIDENKEVKYRVMKSKLDNKLMLTTDSCFIENSMTEWRANG